MATMMPLQACLGGLFIGAACGAYMILVGRIAGNSGVMKALVLGPREPTKIAFLGGLMGGGALMKTLLPGAFEAARAPSLAIALSGLAVGLGVALGNGCTSGHGLCGLSRFSLRSLAAVPTFMGVAIVAATVTTYNGTIGSPLPITPTPQPTIDLAAKLAASLASSCKSASPGISQRLPAAPSRLPCVHPFASLSVLFCAKIAWLPF